MTLWNRSNCLPSLLLSIVLLSSIAIESLHGQGMNTTLPFTSDCRLSRGGHEYAGQVNVTTTGRRCQPWASFDPHYNYFTGSKNFPEGSASAARSNCRNPDEDYNEGAWCYTLDPTKRWELCNIPFCECTLSIDPLGRRYEGQIAFTRSGRRCRRWLNQNPPHPFNDTRYFPDESILEARNYCRNPNGSRPDGPWCYTDGSSAGAWEYCLVPVCNLTAVVFPTPTIPTTTSTTRRPSTRSSTTTRRSTSRTTTFRRTTRNWARSTITRPVATAFPLPQPVVGTESNDAAKIAVPVVVVVLAAIASVIIVVIVLKRSNRFQSSWFRFFNRDGQEGEDSKEDKTTPKDSKLESALENPNFETIPVDDQPSPATQQSPPIKITPTGTSAWYSHNNSDQS